MMKSTIALAAIAAAAHARGLKSQVEQQFSEYCTKYGKNYTNKAEYNERLQNFRDSLNEIAVENAKGHSYTLGLTSYSDWSEDEMSRINGGAATTDMHGEELRAMTDQSDNRLTAGRNVSRPNWCEYLPSHYQQLFDECAEEDEDEEPERPWYCATYEKYDFPLPKECEVAPRPDPRPDPRPEPTPDVKPTPDPKPTPGKHDPIDWRALGHVTPVKAQGDCGSCSMFSAAALLETDISIKYDVQVDLSEQQIVHCSSPGNNICASGQVPQRNYEYLNKVKLMSEEDYPYTNSQTRSEVTVCKDQDQAQKGIAQLKGYEQNSRATVDDLKAQLAKGAVGIQVQASGWGRNYRGGIFTSDSCYNRSNHAVTAVGWGIDESTGADYWIIKNSWGTGWGEDGFMRLAIDHSRNTGACNVRELIFWAKDIELVQE